MKLFSVLILIGIILSNSSCRKASSEIPAFIQCDSALVAPSNFGVANSGIYGLYITVGNDVRGTWQFPFKMPILSEGVNSLLVTPVVRYNNLSSLFIKYEFFKSKIIPLSLVKGQTVDTNFTFEYETAVSMPMNEDMELGINFSNATASSNARNGLQCMKMIANSTTVDSSATAFYSKQVSFDIQKKYVMEFDYYMPSGILAPTIAYTDSKGNTQIAFGDNYLTKNSNWTHVYYDLNPILLTIGNSGLYTPVFILTSPAGVSNSEVYLDNIRILEK